ncbi:MAG: DNA mismatch repair endonuclease MutL [Phycisphaerae bacterium]|nr:DNA mismatch repair endonuclease MutL [Phycisphaerae bacterium]
MPIIHVLSDLLVNKIAAGEVIERPASVVKELVENSLDAGSTRIEIAIENGGAKFIRITDDGNGMEPDDLALCVRPHATSKIRNEEDLFAIQTMGFRGEALPSIGAVSQLRIVSRRKDAQAAHEISMAGERLEPIRATAGPPGTTVEVRQLFFNVPARQKFLRTPQTEVSHITEQLARIALVHPTIEFRLVHNGRLVHHLRPADSMRPRVADFFGREMADTLLEISRDERGLGLFGYVAPPAQSRTTAKWQYLFLNGRFIRDRIITAAVREAYRGLMDPNRHPVVFLSLTIDPANVDVNVHPTKMEVRWRDGNVLYSQILSAIRDRFLNTDLTPTLIASLPRNTSDDSTSSIGSTPSGAADTTTNENASSQQAVMSNNISPVATNDNDAEFRRQQVRQSMAEFFKRAQPIVHKEYHSAPPSASSSNQPNMTTLGQPSGYTSSQSSIPMPTKLVAPETAIQVHGCYLVSETAEGLLIIDQHALHERILFQELSEQFSRGPLESQRFLLAETIDVSPEQIGVIESHEETLHRLGLELSAFGPNAIAIHAAPSLLKPERTREFVRDLLDRLADRQAPASTEMVINDLLSMMACKAAVKAGDSLSQPEIAALMAKRDRVERSTNCPHGRPTSLNLSLAELERQFKRTGF